jgi:hypothetical protein
MTLGFKLSGSEFVDWKSTHLFVIPAQSLPRTRSGAGIQVFFGLPTKPKMDAGLRRHDKSSLCLKARDFNHPRKDIKKLDCLPQRRQDAKVSGQARHPEPWRGI